MRRLRLAAAGFVCAILLAGGAARAQVLADRLPADTVAYVGWAGTNALGPAYDGSHLKTFLDTLKLPDLLASQMRQNLARQTNAQQIKDGKLIQSLLTLLAKSPSALYVGPFDFPANAPPVPRLALICKAGPAAAPLIPDLQELLSRNRAATAPHAGARMAGDYLLITLGDPKLSDALQSATAPASSLASVPAFHKTLQQLGPDAASSPALVYIDAAAALKTLATAVDQSGNTQAQQLMPALLGGFGLGGLTQIAWSGHFDGANWRNSLFVGMQEQRPGLLSLFDYPALDDAALKLIPKSATTAGVLRFDGVRLLESLTNAAAAASPTGPQRIDQAFNQIWTITGVDLKSDLFPGLGDEIIYYGSPDAAGNSILGLTFINPLRDAKKTASALSNLESFINAAIQQRNPNSKVQFTTRTLPAPWEDVTAHVITLPNLSPAWAIRNGTLIIALTLPALQDALGMTTGTKPSILDNPAFVATRSKLPDHPFSAFSFSDLQKSAPEAYQMISRALARNPAAARAFTLPPLDQITPTLGPAMQIIWSDPAGSHVQTISPFPGSGYLSPLQLVGLNLNLQQNGGAAPARARGQFPQDNQLP